MLIVCDRERIIIHTAFSGYPDEPREIRIEQLLDAESRQILKWVFTDPIKLRPEKSTAAITTEAAGHFADLAKVMRERNAFPEHCGERVAHFLVQCLFCMFSEDEQLLPEKIFTHLLANAINDPDKAARRIEKLFRAMQKKGGEYGDYDIPWFNGGLFKKIDIPTLTASELSTLHKTAADMDWRAIDPTIFGTLFERGLDPAARAPLGAHYTDTGTISKLVDPLIYNPLLVEWQVVKASISEKPKQATKLYQTFLLRLNQFRVLDPACGSGNFLYLALKALRDVERYVHVEASELGLPAELSMQTGPHNILGIEINEFAAELARVTVWIGDIQWCRRNGYNHAMNPILQPLDGIENRDALMNADGSEAQWPKADVIVGNPPFLGDKKMLGELGADYVNTLRKTYEGRLPGGADLVCYWFEKARAHLEKGYLRAAGLVSTNSIRGGASRKVLDRITETTRIFEAWSDEHWVNDGAAVRVSMIGFGEYKNTRLDGIDVKGIYADLSVNNGSDITKAKPLTENFNTSFQGVTPRAEIQKKRKLELGLPSASFLLEGDAARKILRQPANVYGKPMSEVVKPYLIADDITTRHLDRFIVNFERRSEFEASVFEEPFAEISNVRLHRQQMADAKGYPWWQLWRPRAEMFAAFAGLSRYISIPRVAKHHILAWTPAEVVPGDALVLVARSDDTTFGILHSRFHELWSLRLGSSLEDRPRYTPITTFETFPFPEGLTPANTKGQSIAEEKLEIPSIDESHLPVARKIAEAAKRLNELRNNWLNPREWVDWVITLEEEKVGFPRRPVAKPGHEADLKKRTLTNLYNARADGKAAWLDIAHKSLDMAVAEAYGWMDYSSDMSDEEILRRLLILNRERSQ